MSLQLNMSYNLRHSNLHFCSQQIVIYSDPQFILKWGAYRLEDLRWWDSTALVEKSLLCLHWTDSESDAQARTCLACWVQRGQAHVVLATDFDFLLKQISNNNFTISYLLDYFMASRSNFQYQNHTLQWWPKIFVIILWPSIWEYVCIWRFLNW